MKRRRFVISINLLCILLILFAKNSCYAERVTDKPSNIESVPATILSSNSKDFLELLLAGPLASAGNCDAQHPGNCLTEEECLHIGGIWDEAEARCSSHTGGSDTPQDPDTGNGDSGNIPGVSGEPVIIYKGRMWQKIYRHAIGATPQEAGLFTFEEANDYCENLNYGGYSDWQLPTKEALKSLVVCTNGTPTPLRDYVALTDGPWSCGEPASGEEKTYVSPTIDSIFLCTNPLHGVELTGICAIDQLGDFWTRTHWDAPSHLTGTYVFYVTFYNGKADVFKLEYNPIGYARCVRDI